MSPFVPSEVEGPDLPFEAPLDIARGERTTEQRNLALYVHWPFCVSKCPYCDFNAMSHGRRPDGWREAMLETSPQARLLAGRGLTSIFFGGGKLL